MSAVATCLACGRKFDMDDDLENTGLCYDCRPDEEEKTVANYILDKAYKVTDTDGVPAYRVVVYGTNAGECALPGAANAPKILGVTLHAQPLKGQNVVVRKAGIANIVASGAITLGTPVNVAGTTGKVKAISEVFSAKINCVGFAETAASVNGDIIEVFLSFHERTARLLSE